MYNTNIYRESDTLSGMAFFTQDSFAFIYQIRKDSDYLYPLFRGSWLIIGDTLAQLKYDNGVKKTGKFEFDGQFTFFCLEASRFSQQNN